MTTRTTATALAHLQRIVTHWDDLAEALGAPNTATWPPSGLRNYLAALDAMDAAETAEQRTQQRLAERNPAQLGERPVPISLRVYDTMRAVEAALVHITDQVASDIQRPALTVANTRRGWQDEIQIAAVALAMRDRDDARRWHFGGTRTAVQAAVWLAHRLRGHDGPFRPVTVAHIEQIDRIAESGAQRIENTLSMRRRARQLDEPCPHCRGRLRIEGGDGTDPAVRCTACGWHRTAADTTAA